MARALVLGGGGARGAFQVGMLLELVGTKQLDFTILRGVSVYGISVEITDECGATSSFSPGWIGAPSDGGPVVEIHCEQ